MKWYVYGGFFVWLFFFPQQVFFQREGQSDNPSGCFQPSVYILMTEALGLCVYPRVTHLGTDLQKAKGGNQIEG